MTPHPLRWCPGQVRLPKPMLHCCPCWQHALAHWLLLSPHRGGQIQVLAAGCEVPFPHCVLQRRPWKHSG